MQKFATLIFILLLLQSPAAKANICGTDYQNFNPTTNGLDFVTVQSSETLKPCIVNMGFFLNYAANSLTYSKTLNQDYQNGQKRQDRLLGADVSVGMGLTDKWDLGVNVPFLLSHSVENDYYVSSIDENGATEIKANTKYRLLGDERGGVAFILSVNKNLIENNPFSGRGAGLTWNYELAADTVIAEKWAAGVNVGYRDRDPGAPIAGVPFVPMDDQWIYSVAASYLITSIDTKVIFEVFGSKAAKTVDQDTDRSLNSLEGLIGVKNDVSDSLALHAGFGRQIDNSLGGADWRVYAGFNWAIGPVCGKKPVVVAQAAPTEPATPTAAPEPEVFTLDVGFLFKTDSDQVEEEQFEKLHTFFVEVFHRPYERFSVEGHTDSVGPDEYNMDLSRRRANFVRKYFIEKFKVPADKIEAMGYGSTRPIADNGNYQGRRKNRRVELKIWRPSVQIR